jgi:hypothetical protein
MIRNLAKDSPAEKAGLDRYDVIVAAGEEEVVDGVEGFSRYVRDRAPGDALTLSVFHEGRRRDVSVTLGEIPSEWSQVSWKHDVDPDVAQWRDFGLRGRILRRGPEGWIAEDLGPVPDMPGISQLFEEHIQGWRDDPPDFHLFRSHDGAAEARRVTRDGQVLHVAVKEDGRVEVRRERRGEDSGEAEVTVHENREALCQADAEACELLKSVTTHRPPRGAGRDLPQRLDALRRNLPRRPMTAPPPSAPPFPAVPPAPDWNEWSERFFQGPLERRHGAPRPPAPPVDDRPTTRFEVDGEGRINVHVPNRDGELSKVYPSEDALEEQAPELHKQFRDLHRAIR